MKFILKKIPKTITGEVIERKEPCRICDEKSGVRIGAVDYWNLAKSDIIKCPVCGLSQLDPMLTEDQTSKGCLAYYIEESLRVSNKEQNRNLLRNFRRGHLFGLSLKRKGIYPKEVLELGPGSGYFAYGLKFVFPESTVIVMDVNEEVLKFNKNQHGFETVQASPETCLPQLENKFDLIIARDILEHVIDISIVTDNLKKYLRNQGVLHFITPNGHEDVWKHYLTYKFQHKRSELLINHVNYFDGRGLLTYLGTKGFIPLDYYNYTLKTTRRGRGWKTGKKLMAQVSQEKNAGYYLTEKIAEVREISYDKKDILSKWYIGKSPGFLLNIISWYHHAHLIKVIPETNVGHETYGLFKLTK